MVDYQALSTDEILGLAKQAPAQPPGVFSVQPEEVDYSKLTTEDIFAQAEQLPEPGPELRADYPSVWRRLGNMFTDPQAEGAKAVLAIVDAEMHNITPSQAMRLRPQIDRNVKINPARAKLRGDLTTIVRQNLATGYAQVNLGLWGAQALMGDNSDDTWKAIRETQASIPKEEEKPYPEGLLQEFAGSTAEMFPFLAEAAKRGAWRGMMLAGGTWLLGTVTGMPEVTYPLIPAMYAVGQTSASLEFVGKVEGGMAFVDMMEYKDPETGEKINPDVARAAAFGVGVINGLLEFAQLRTLVNAFPGGRKLFAGLINETVIEAVESGALKDILVRTVRTYGRVIATETAQEVAQESTNIVAEILAKKVTNLLDDTDLSGPEISTILDRLAQTAKTSAQAFTLMGIPGPTISAAVSIRQARAGDRLVIERQERAGKIFKATAVQRLRQREEDRAEVAIEITPEEIQKYIDDPESSSITDEDLDRIIGDEANEDVLIEDLLRRSGIRVGAPDIDVPAQIGELEPAPWPEGFPQAEIHTTMANINRKYPDLHERAKAGEDDAAIELVSSVINPEKIAAMGERFPGATIVPVIAMEATGNNQTPRAFAAAIEDIAGLSVEDEIIQVNSPQRTGRAALHRVFARPVFEGPVTAGQDYIIVDDHITQGGTLSELRKHIERGGGQVVAMVSLTASRGSVTVAIKLETIKALSERFGKDGTDSFLQEYGIASSIEELTESEARYLLKFKTLDAIRDRATQEGYTAVGLEGQRPLLPFEAQEIALPDQISPGDISPEGRPLFKIGERPLPAKPLPVFDPSKIKHLGLRDAVEAGLISDDLAAGIDGILEIFPGAWKDKLEPRVSAQQFVPTEAQLVAHGVPVGAQQEKVVRGALLTEEALSGVRDDARSLAVMFAGSDLTTVLHEFGEFAYQRVLTPEERAYVSGVSGRRESGKSANEYFSDEFRNFMVRELEGKESIYPPKLIAILRRVAEAIREVWQRIRNYHRTPALDDLFREILKSDRRLQAAEFGVAAIGDQARTLRGAIKAAGGINFLHFTGELRNMVTAVKFLSSKTGVPIDVLEGELKTEGWLSEGESLIDILRDDPSVLRRGRIGELGEDIFTKQERELTDTERQLKEEMEREVEGPPRGEYAAMKAEDLPEGERLTIVEGTSEDGWDVYDVVEKDPFGITLADGRIIELSPNDEVEVLTKRYTQREILEQDQEMSDAAQAVIDKERAEAERQVLSKEANEKILKLIREGKAKKRIVGREVKARVRRITGQALSDAERTERNNLRDAMKMAARQARIAFREGKSEGLAEGKARIRALVAKAQAAQKLRDDAGKIRRDIEKALKKTAAKKVGGKPRGKFGAERQVVLDRLRSLLSLSGEKAAEQLEGNLVAYADKIPPYEIAFENRLLDMKSTNLIDIDEEKIGVWSILLDDIVAYKAEGVLARERLAANRQSLMAMYRQEVIDVVGGIPEGVETVGEEAVTDKSVGAMLKRAFIAGEGLNVLQGWRDILDILSFKDVRTAPGQSLISQFGDVLDVKNAEKAGNMKEMEGLWQIVFDAYGLTSDHEMIKQFRKDSEIVVLGQFKDFKDRIVELKMSKTQARKKVMEMMDESLFETFFSVDGMAWSEEMAMAVKEFLDPEDLSFVDKQMEWYRDYYKSTNKTYADIYGINLPSNPFYSPISRQGVNRDEDTGLGEFMKEMPFRASATSAGSLKSRTANVFPLAFNGDVEVLMRHVTEMEHFKAWAHKIRDLNAVFSHPEVSMAIRINYGQNINKHIQSFIQDFARGGAETAQNIGALDKLRVRYTKAVLAVKPTLFLKQMTSTIAFADSIPVGYFAKEVVKLHELPKAVDVLMQSTMMQHRWKKGEIERDIKTAMNSSEFAKFRTSPSFTNRLLFNIKLGDAGAIIAGGWPVYKYYKNVKGFTHEEALRMFESVAEVTQQSADLSEQSSWQRGSSFAKLFTMFMTSPNQYLRKEIGAIRNLAAGRIDKKQFAKTMLIYHILLPMFFQWVSDRFTWDEDEQLRATILGSLNGFFILGDGLDFLLRSALGLQTFDLGIPIWSAFEDMGKAFKLLDPDNLDDEGFLRAIRGLAGAVGAAVGQPLKQIVDITKGFSDTLAGEYEKGIAELMGWSPFAAEKAAEKE